MTVRYGILEADMHALEEGKTTASEEAVLWEACGGLELTGWPDEPLYPGFQLASRLAGLSGQLARFMRNVPSLQEILSARALLGRRDGLDIRRRGRVSAGGSCRLLACKDGWVALNLPREEDFEMLPAFLAGLGLHRWEAPGGCDEPGAPRGCDEPGAPGGCDEPGAPAREAAWHAVEQALGRVPASLATQWGSELGLAIGLLPNRLDAQEDRPKPVKIHHYPARHICPCEEKRVPLVVDLSSLWAGPLCAMLLRRAGMDVVNLESQHRPDPTRYVSPSFFNWLREGQSTSLLDFSTSQGRQELARVLDRADVVIEASRPRAMAQLGIDPEAILATRPGKIWVSITAHGRSEGASRIGLGDDAAVEGGLVAWDSSGSPVFCADAIADPASGLVAALTALKVRCELLASPHLLRSALLEVSMTQVARHLAS